jgi:glycosyltransferase involved in cell wall biosynthesis
MAKFTVVTACKNAVRYVEETVDSVLSQSVFRAGQCELEYLVFDGASTDGTVQRLRPYERHGVRLVSEPDSGLYSALAKGLQQATGDYVAYLNAGDFLNPAGLSIAADCFELPGVDWLTGYTAIYNERSQLTKCALPFRYSHRLIQCGAYGTLLQFVQQESTVWRRSLHAGVDFRFLSTLRFAGDAYLWNRFSAVAQLHVVRGHIGGFRIHKGQVSENRDGYLRELRSFSRQPSVVDRIHAMLEGVMWALPEPIRSPLAGRSKPILFDHARQAWGHAPPTRQ